MYQLTFYVPESHVESVKTALFNAGAGRLGNYEHCAWQVLGDGQFRPLKNSQPFLGQQNELTKVAEYKVEMICADDCIDQVVIELKKSHPYEEVGYAVIKLYRVE